MLISALSKWQTGLQNVCGCSSDARGYNLRMAQTMQWLQAIRSCMRKVRLKYPQCMASFPAQTAKFSSNYIMIHPIFVGVVSLRMSIKVPAPLATLAF